MRPCNSQGFGQDGLIGADVPNFVTPACKSGGATAPPEVCLVLDLIWKTETAIPFPVQRCT